MILAMHPGREERARKRILIVDDDPDVRAYIGDVAGGAGYDVDLAASFTDMRRKLNLSRPDLIVIDLIMPDTDGIECLEFVVSIPRAKELPVLMISGSDRKMLSIAWRLGRERGLNMAGELAKPFTVAELEARLVEILANGGAGSAPEA